MTSVPRPTPAISASEAARCSSLNRRPESGLRDFVPLLHEEMGRLPERYRLPLMLHYFEGKSTEETATQLRCPVGTVKGRLSRARDRLRDRFSRRGLTFPH